MKCSDVCLFLPSLCRSQILQKPLSAERKSKDLEEKNDDLENVIEKLQTLRNEGNFR